MSDIATKLQYLNTTKGKIKDVINMTGVGITNDTFRSYAQSLYNGYIATLQDKGTLLDNMNKGTSTGTISGSANLPVYEYKASKLSTQGDLPSGYTQVDYIQSSGTQYIITSVVPKSTHKYNFKFSVNDVAPNQCIFGSRTSGTYSTSTNQIYAGKQVNYYYKYVGTTSQQTPITANTIYDMEILANSGDFDNTATQPFYLFTLNNKGSTSGNLAGKLYSFKIYDNNNLINDYVPCYRNSDNEVGLYDLVNNVFYTNQGTGTFTYGSKAPTPESPVEVNTVKGYRNLANIYVIPNTSKITIANDTISITNNDNTAGYFNTGKKLSELCPNLQVGDTVYLFFNSTSSSSNKNIIYITGYNNSWGITQAKVITQTMLDGYVILYGGYNEIAVISNFMITKLANAPYVPYGNNYIYTTISDGTNSRNVTIPLNDNEICGIGDYKDELVIDKYGHAKLNKKIGKVVFDGSESWTVLFTNYFVTSEVSTLIKDEFVYSNLFSYIDFVSLQATTDNRISVRPNGQLFVRASQFNNDKDAFITFLGNNNAIVYYVLATPTEIDLGNIDMELYEGTNNITNSENMDMSIRFIKNTYE